MTGNPKPGIGWANQVLDELYDRKEKGAVALAEKSS